MTHVGHWSHRALSITLLGLAIVSCTEGSRQAPGALSSAPVGDGAVVAPVVIPSVSEGCVDRDGDGLGAGCAAGPDCDDGSAYGGWRASPTGVSRADREAVPARSAGAASARWP